MQNILSIVSSGATLTVSPHDALNPHSGFYAKLEGFFGEVKSTGFTVDEALKNLDDLAGWFKSRRTEMFDDNESRREAHKKYYASQQDDARVEAHIQRVATEWSHPKCEGFVEENESRQEHPLDNKHMPRARS